MTTLPFQFKFIPKSFLVICTIVLKSLFLGSCIGGDEKVGPIYDIDSISTAYCIFPDSSLWVYELEGASFVDSIIVVKTNLKTVEPNNGLSPDGFISWSYRFISVNSTLSSLTGRGSLTPMVDTKNPEISEMIHWNGLAQIGIFYGSDSLSFESPQTTSGTEILLIEKHDSLNIGSLVFRHVLVFENSEHKWSNAPSKIYWANGIGRVRVETINGEVWNLIDYGLK